MATEIVLTFSMDAWI